MRDYALFVGRLVDYKGVEDLVLAFKELNHCKLKIIGDGPLLKSLERDIQGVKNIELLGKLPYDKTIEYIRRSRFVVFPSRCYENMPRIIVESFACGVPVLASNLGAAGEMIADNETGLLFAPRDRKDLEVKIKYMLAEPEDVLRMGKNARKVYEERYTAEVNYRLLMNIYDSLKEKMSCKIKG